MLQFKTKCYNLNNSVNTFDFALFFVTAFIYFNASLLSMKLFSSLDMEHMNHSIFQYTSTKADLVCTHRNRHADVHAYIAYKTSKMDVLALKSKASFPTGEIVVYHPKK